MKYVWLIIAYFTLSSCAEKLDNSAFFRFFNTFQSGSYIEKKENGFKYQLQYRPTDFLAITHLRGKEELSGAEIETAKKEFADGLTFCLRVAADSNEDVLKKNTFSTEEYYQRIAALNMEFPYLVLGVNDQDTFTCQFHHFERTYNVQPFIQVLFNLSIPENKVPDKILFKDEIFNEGIVIEFSNFKEYQKHLPMLDL